MEGSVMVKLDRQKDILGKTLNLTPRQEFFLQILTENFSPGKKLTPG